MIKANGAVLFVLGTTMLAVILRRSLTRSRPHGFYRFWARETLLAMFVLNLNGWFTEALSWRQLISWALLVVSLVLVILGVRVLREVGQQDAVRSDPALLGMEKASGLVTIGVHRYIRHPLYSSLLFLAWGILFKSSSGQLAQGRAGAGDRRGGRAIYDLVHGSRGAKPVCC